MHKHYSCYSAIGIMNDILNLMSELQLNVDGTIGITRDNNIVLLSIHLFNFIFISYCILTVAQMYKLLMKKSQS